MTRPRLSKILTESELVALTSNDKSTRFVFTNGCFDILHKGHVAYLEQAKELGDQLIVALNTDESVQTLKGPDRPINPLQDRMEVIAALECVDLVVSFNDETPLRLIEAITPSVLVKGGDYTPDQIVGSDWVLRHGGVVKSLSFIEGQSTSLVITKIKS